MRLSNDVARCVGVGSDEEGWRECTWSHNWDGYCETTCGAVFEFVDGGPTENKFCFCPYCGKDLVEQPYTGDTP